MLHEFKKVVPKNIRKTIKKQVIKSNTGKEKQQSNNPNLGINNITIDSNNVVLSITDNQRFKISRIGVLVSAEHKIYNLNFMQKDNKILIKQEEIHAISEIGKHVFRIFYEDDKKAHTLQLIEDLIEEKYVVSTEQTVSNNFIYFYTNSNGNLTIEVVSRSKRKTASKHIQGYLDGQLEPIKQKVALFEPNHGKTNSGNMFALAIELASRNNFEVYWASKDVVSAQQTFDFYGIENIKVIEHLSYEYGNIIATAQLLFSDNTFYPFFSKRLGQKYINTWHGTPLKTLGKDIKGEEISYGNIVKNLLQVDAMYLSNSYTAEHHLSSLNLEGVLKNEVYVAPSPRNSSFFKIDNAVKIRENEQIQNKKVLVYLPTYRGKSSFANSSTSGKIEELLSDFISLLPSDYIIYYKLHPIDDQKLNVPLNDRIRKIPENYELYDFLSATDGLITDYSSVMFDYALANKPIFLYAYDQNEYFEERGTYLDIDELPFEKFEESKSLINAINIKKEFSANYSEFKNKFTAYDNANGAKEIIDHVLFRNKSERIVKYDSYNGKPNVYIMGGPLWANGITSALQNLIDNIDLDKRNYILIVDTNGLKKENLGRYAFLDERIKIYPIKGFAIRSNFEDGLVKSFEAGGTLSPFETKLLEQAFMREMKRIFGDNAPDYFIHFAGYEVKFAEFIMFMKHTQTSIYVHNDMFKEYANKQNYNRNIIPKAYHAANKVVLVNDRLKASFIEHFPDLENNIVVANNFIGYKNIKNTENENLEELLFNTTFQYSIASQGNGNPLSALKLRLIEGVKNREIRFEKINNVYKKIDQIVGGIVRNNYLKINDEQVIKKILVQNYFGNEWEEFIDAFGDDDDTKSLLINLLFPKVCEIYRTDILPYVSNYRSELFNIILNNCPDRINFEKNELENVYDNFGLRKLEVIEELHDSQLKIFINIARFDNQKRLDRLILAFEKVFALNKDTRLYIVASYGTEKENILNIVKNSSARQAIRIFGAMDNPYPLLKQCDCFVFTSDYEALGLVVYEALAVGLPVVTTNLASTMRNLNQEQVYPVDLTIEGVFEGMEKFLEGDFPNKPFDFESYEQKSKNEFENIFFNN